MEPDRSKAIASPVISVLSRDCTKAIDDVLAAVRLSSDRKRLEVSVEDARGRFRVWVSNLGALQPAKSPKSLEHRLGNAPLMRGSVISGLERLLSSAKRGKHTSSPPSPVPNQYVNELTRSANGILSDGTPNKTTTGSSESFNVRSDGNRPEVNELDELLLSISSSISHLFSLSMLIRRQRPKGRLPALDNFTPAESSPDITNVTDKFPKSKELP